MTNSYYYELDNDPDYPCETNTPNTGDATYPCNVTTLYPEPVQLEFKNNNYNAAYNNAIQLRRTQQTGSLNSNTSGIFELDKRADQILPSNLNAVLSGSAVTASFQESNLYSKTWTSGRYDGTKLNSGSLFYNDPALTFKSFEAAKFDLFESSSLIRSKSYSELDIKVYYFNSPYKTVRTDLNAYFQGSVSSQPPIGQPIYELVKKDFKRITRSKIYIPGTDDIVQLVDGLAQYEAKPSVQYSGSSLDNIFTYNVNTISTNGDTLYYWNETNTLTRLELRAGEDEEIIISGTYLADLNTFSTDAPDSTTRTGVASDYNGSFDNIYVSQPWQSVRGRQKTNLGNLISSSRNVT